MGRSGKTCACDCDVHETNKVDLVNALERLRAAVRQAPVCLVEVVATQGSAPRGPGAWMAVQAEGLIGTIGGGHLEWEATRLARAWLAQGLPGPVRSLRLALGPSLGQCCGGAVDLRPAQVSQHVRQGGFLADFHGDTEAGLCADAIG